MIVSDDEITTPVIYATELDSFGEDGVRGYIERYGVENLNKNSLAINLSQTENEPNHAMYFHLRNLGMKTIPIAMNEETKEILDALGVIK